MAAIKQLCENSIIPQLVKDIPEETREGYLKSATCG